MAKFQNLHPVFVNNIPMEVDSKWLYGIFEKNGRVEEVYIPSKRNKEGRKFGFVRFGERSAAEVAVRTFNRMWLLNHRLGVNMARFGKGVGLANETKFMKPDSQELDNPKGHNFKMANNRAGTLNGCSSTEGDAGFQLRTEKEEATHTKSSSKSCLGTVNGEIVEILKKSVVGISHRKVDGNYIKECLIGEGVIDIDIRSISDRVFLLSFEDDDVLKTMEAENWSWLKNWFIKIVHWNDELLLPPRCLWLQCSGVPVIGWSKDTFNSIAGLWGKLIYSALDTEKGNQFHHGFILVAIEDGEKIDEVIEVVVNGSVCRVKIKELDGDPFVSLDDLDKKSKLVSISSKSCDTYPDDVQDNIVIQSNPANDDGVRVETFNDIDFCVKSNICETVVATKSLGKTFCKPTPENMVVFDSRSGTNIEAHGHNLNQTPSILSAPDSLCSFNQDGGKNEGSGLLCADSLLVKESDDDISVWESGSEEGDCYVNVESIEAARLKKRVGRRKAIDLILAGCPKGPKWSQDYKHKAKKPKKVMARIRPALSMEEACSLLEAGTEGSISEGGFRNCNRAVLQEAKHTWEVGKALGLSFGGDEQDLIDKLVEMEHRDQDDFRSMKEA